MLEWFDDLRHVTMHAIILRVLLAMLCGGMIGLERSFKRRPAGFRTHILVCIGACITTLTSQFLYLNMHYPTDMARIGAQVIAGMGFIGAGTIIVTRKNTVKGLTTAAGLWASAIIGLCFGAGFYEGGVLATALLLIAEIFFSRLEHKLMRNAQDLRYAVVYDSNDALAAILTFFRTHRIRVDDMEITRRMEPDEEDKEAEVSNAFFSLKLPGRLSKNALVEPITEIPGVISIDEL